MDFQDSPEEAAFRAECAGWLVGNAPAICAALRSLADMREIEQRARELLTAVKFAGESGFGPPVDRFPGYEARVPSEFVTNLEAALARSAPEGER